MLNCVYHFKGDMVVVDDEEKDKLLETGVWFDHPLKARDYNERQLRTEPKHTKQKARKKGDDDEK